MQLVIGKLEKYAWPGGYPIAYIMDDGETMCADCANDSDNPVHLNLNEVYSTNRDGWGITGYAILEDGPEQCCHCYKPIGGE